MKRFAFVFLLAIGLVPLASAQEAEHVQVDVFADYLRLGQIADTNFAGVGGRLGVTVYQNLKFEGEVSYDFAQSYTQIFTNGTGTVVTRQSQLRILHGEFGPKVNLTHEYRHFHPFVFAKGGFISFRNTRPPAVLSTFFFSSASNLNANSWNPVLFAGGGAEGHVGPVGVRFDIGDEIYFIGGSHNNLRLTLGPYIRF